MTRSSCPSALYAEREAATGQLFVGALVLLGVLVVLTVAGSYLAARISEVVLINARRRTFDAFVAASWDVRSRDRTGYLQELLTTHAKKVGTGASVLADGVASALGFVAFLGSALLISPLAALTILVGVLVLSALLRPVTRLTRTKSRAHAASNADYALALTDAAALARELRAFDADDVVASEVNRRAVDTARLSFSTRFLGKLTPALHQNAGLLLVILGMAGVYALDVGDVSSLGAVILLLIRALSKSEGVRARSNSRTRLRHTSSASPSRPSGTSPLERSTARSGWSPSSRSSLNACRSATTPAVSCCETCPSSCKAPR